MEQICYTNNKVSDIWDMFYEQNRKFCDYPLYLISDIEHQNKKYNNIYLYKNEMPYWKVWVDVLNDIKTDYFLYLQEDFILYKPVNKIQLDNYQQFLEDNQSFSFVRLLKSGYLDNCKQINNTLFEIPSDNQSIFSMQPTIWRKKDFIKLYEATQSLSWLEPIIFTEKCKELNITGVYHYNNEPKRGMAHYDSDVYPYIATALVKGRWNFSEYLKELKPLCEQYNINTELRGTTND